MFVQKKKHRSGRISIVVVDKSSGKPKEIKSFGVANTETELEYLYSKAKKWIQEYTGNQELDFVEAEVKRNEENETERVLSNIDSLLINGHQLILNQVYDSIGFNQIETLLEYLDIKYKKIERIKNTKHMYSLKDKEKREKNVEKAFKNSLNLEDKNVLIVDDIVTSGATIYSISEELRKDNENINIKVFSIAIARHFIME